MRRLLSIILLSLMTAVPEAAAQGGAARIETVRDWDEERVSFWLSIYTVYDSTQSVIHDNQYPHVIYEVLSFTSGEAGAGENDVNNINNRQARINQTVQKYQEILGRFASGKLSYHDMQADDWRVFNMLKPVNDPNKYLNAASRDRLRVQDGRRDNFLAGLKRSGKYLDGIQTIFRTFNLPTQLTALIFVESLFYPKAISKVGAAGPWQLMPDTGRRYLTVGEAVDERFDPFIATVAAAQILKENYEKLDGSWPLAITAYNHGLGGMLRAKAQYKSQNLEEIIRTYKSDSFKFASKNFYAQYLAAVDAFTNAERYFGKFERDTPMNYDRLRVPYAVHYKELVETTGIAANEIEELNPALTSRVVTNALLVPEGYPLRVPVGKGTAAIQALRDKESERKSVRRKPAGAQPYEATALPVMLDQLQPKK